MNEKLLKTIYNAIPCQIGEIYLDHEARQEISHEIALKLDGDCEHEWKVISQVKIIEPSVCKKCGKLKSKMVE
jgi:hypothetical protein